jgi:hypothetical protein
MVHAWIVAAVLLWRSVHVGRHFVFGVWQPAAVLLR